MTRINSLWHATAMAADYDALYGPLQRLFGAVVMHDHISHEPGIGRRGGMVWLGDNSIEIGAPVGDRSPVRNFVERWGGGMHSFAMQVPNGEAYLEHLEAHGVSVQARLTKDMYFTKPADTAGLLLEWTSSHTDDDPRWGFALRPQEVTPVVDVAQYAFLTAVVNDPVAVAGRLSVLLGTEILRVNADAKPDEIAAIVSLADNLLLLYPMPTAGSSTAVWGSEITRNRLHAHGLRVADLDGALAALKDVGVGVARRDENLVYLDPTSVPIPTFLCQQLLPEDPRVG